jgi:alkylhydroperoxidase domain protein/CMD domain protein
MTTPTAQTDIISTLIGIQPGSLLSSLRAQRPEAAVHTQGSYAALFAPADTGGLSLLERLAAALRVARLHECNPAVAHFHARLSGAGGGQRILAEVASPSPEQTSDLEPLVKRRLQAILRHADLLARRPAQATPDNLQALADVGLSTREIVSLSQVIAFVSFFARVIAALQALGAEAPSHAEVVDQSTTPEPRRVLEAARVIRPPHDLNRPRAFTVDQLAWTPWLQPLDMADATPQQVAALEGDRANSPYFRLLALDADVLIERTATDRGIFYTHGGAPRADRELAAAATSRLNGCIYCTSVHAARSAQLSKRDADIDRLLRLGVEPGTPLDLDERWQGVVDASVALARTPPALTRDHVGRLRATGLADLELLDVLQSGAFFAWANRLMLTLGEPHYAASAQA